jgi:hypothetical protein
VGLVVGERGKAGTGFLAKITRREAVKVDCPRPEKKRTSVGVQSTVHIKKPPGHFGQGRRSLARASQGPAEQERVAPVWLHRYWRHTHFLGSGAAGVADSRLGPQHSPRKSLRKGVARKEVHTHTLLTRT